MLLEKTFIFKIYFYLPFFNASFSHFFHFLLTITTVNVSNIVKRLKADLGIQLWRSLTRISKRSYAAQRCRSQETRLVDLFFAPLLLLRHVQFASYTF